MCNSGREGMLIVRGEPPRRDHTDFIGCGEIPDPPTYCLYCNGESPVFFLKIREK